MRPQHHQTQQYDQQQYVQPVPAVGKVRRPSSTNGVAGLPPQPTGPLLKPPRFRHKLEPTAMEQLPKPDWLTRPVLLEFTVVILLMERILADRKML